jgi:dethiobiotin synthetase
MSKPACGLFITGNDTDVGKTYVACLIARQLTAQGVRVGVYKPAASGCYWRGDELISDDAVALWQAAGSPGELSRVCPQRFEAPLAPHLAARAEGRSIDCDGLRRGVDYWLERSDLVLVEGAGGLLSPIADDEFVADVACDLGLPLVVVARNALGAINQTLQTLVAAATFRQGLPVAGVVLNRISNLASDISLATNRAELQRLAVPPILAEVLPGATDFDAAVDWLKFAASIPA